MNTLDEINYRLRLSQGFLEEAEQDFDLRRWRACVDNSQLVVENAGKAVLAAFDVSPKTHEPAKQVAAILRRQELPDEIAGVMQQMLPDLLALGATEHFLTDYGDEGTYTLPWDLFDESAATDAIEAARRALAHARELVAAVNRWRQS